MALMPLESIDFLWSITLEEAPINSPPIDQLIQYYVRNWLQNNGRPRALWNHYGATEHRSNNDVEGIDFDDIKLAKRFTTNVFDITGFHNRLRNKNKYAHPAIYRFIETINVIHSKNRLDKMELDVPRSGPKPKASDWYEPFLQGLDIENQSSLKQFFNNVAFKTQVNIDYMDDDSMQLNGQNASDDDNNLNPTQVLENIANVSAWQSSSSLYNVASAYSDAMNCVN